MKPLHAYVATPAYDGKVDTDYSQSLAEACQAATVFGVRVTASVMGGGAFIDLSRNIFINYFLENDDYTHLFYIDADVGFPQHAFVNLIQADKPVVCGVYRRRQKKEDYPAVWAPHPELSKEAGQDVLWVEEDNWLQCSRVPTGFLCIRRDIIEEMAEKAIKLDISGQENPVPRLFYTKIDERSRFVGEDFAWSDDYVEQYGRNIEVLADIDFVHGGYEGNYAKWLSGRVEEYKKKKGLLENESRRLGDRRKAGL